jgi:hypothetical protein
VIGGGLSGSSCIAVWLYNPCSYILDTLEGISKEEEHILVRAVREIGRERESERETLYK